MKRPHRGATLLMMILAGAWAGSVLVLGAAPAVAVQPSELDVVANADPVNWTPHVLDGEVRAVAEINGVVLVGGSFTEVQNAGGGTVYQRSNLFAYNASNGQVLTGFAPDVSSTVYWIEPAADGSTAYLAGKFTSVDGVARTNRLARINAATGAVVTSFQSPGFNGIIKDAVLRNGKLYLGGTFTLAGPDGRTVLAAVDPDSGALLSEPNLTFSQPRNGGALQIIKFDITPDGSQLFATGNFTKVDGADRYQIAKLDISGTSVTLADWQTTRFTNACSSSFDTYMRDIDVSSDGSYFVVATTGGYSGGGNIGTLCDTVSRWPTGTGGTGQQPAWVAYTGGDTLWSVAAGGEAVYAGGHFRWFNNPFAADSAGQGAVAREGIAALDPRNGLPLTWNPGRERGVGVFALVTTARGLYVGSDTDRIGNSEYHAKLALMPRSGGQPLSEDTVVGLPGDVYSLGSGLGDTVVRRSFTGTTVTDAATLDSSVAWSQSRGAFMAGGLLYTGLLSGFTGSLQVRSFDGTTFGEPSTVPLNNLTSFATELRTVTGMFFDPTRGRLYFTLANSNQLYYRYFTPESAVVGAQRFTATTGLSDLNFAQVASMFQAGEHLYVASSDGNLRRYTWDAAAGVPVAGTATVVSDGQNWRARGAFVMEQTAGAGR